jgi:Ca2+-binding RTX toxin-like protein
MSTKIWTNPNDPNPADPTRYDIGTEGRELFPIAVGSGVFNTFLNVARSIYKNVTGLADIIVPTYGLWAGPGWAGGQRLTGDENGDIKWSRPPCYNENIKEIAKPENSNLDPESCLSVVDAITKTHDWMYTQAENKKASGEYNDLEYKNALLTADVYMLHNVAEALKNNCTYTSPTGEYLGNGQWEEKTYTNTLGLDAAEEAYLKKLVPLFLLKIKIQDDSESKTWLSQAITDAQTIKSYLPFYFESFVDPIDPSIVSTIEENNGIIIIQQEKALSSDAWIMDMNSTKDPVHITITYDANSSKSADIFVINDDGSISINCGLESEITFSGAKNNGSAGYTFKVTGGDGYNKYNLDSSFKYELIDNGNNDINITSLNDEGLRVDNVGSLYREEGSWVSLDGSIVLNDQMITLSNGNTIDLGDDFQYSAFGINLITLPATPTSFNPIYLNTEDPDNTDHRDTWLDHLSTSADDKIVGGSGHDVIVNGGVVGGTDWLQGNAGNDFIQSFSNNNAILQGGSGVDALMGGGGSDQIFCDTSDFNGDGQIDTMAQMIARGETAASLSARGDLAQGSSGNDFIYGSDAQDGLFGNHGNDVIAGGGDDEIYGGTGNDTIFGGMGYDFIEGGADNSIYFMDNAGGNNVISFRHIIPFIQKIKHQKYQKRQNTWRRFLQQENLRRAA